MKKKTTAKKPVAKKGNSKTMKPGSKKNLGAKKKGKSVEKKDKNNEIRRNSTTANFY